MGAWTHKMSWKDGRYHPKICGAVNDTENENCVPIVMEEIHEA
jgi:hypothetical protein